MIDYNCTVKEFEIGIDDNLCRCDALVSHIVIVKRTGKLLE
jgi:hypothetical protein